MHFLGIKGAQTPLGGGGGGSILKQSFEPADRVTQSLEPAYRMTQI